MSELRTLRIGTRASALARTQTGGVASALGRPFEIVQILTQGDRSQAAVSQIGGTGVFVTTLRTALLAGEIDVAVHSYKDLPTAPADGITIAAVPAREDSRDALVARDGLTLGELAPGARVGTGSPRRAAQLNALGLGIEVVPIRGNVDTRIAKVGVEVDAVVLALAGLRRLGREAEVTEVLDPIQILPAPAQGALAIECRTEDTAAIELLCTLDHADTRVAVAAERALLAALEAGCSAPVAALAEVVEADLHDRADDRADGTVYDVFLRGSVTALDGSDAVRLSATGPTTDAAGVGRRLAADLLADGAATMMGSTT
jgi:hydroxymethylbilane synthase